MRYASETCSNVSEVIKVFQKVPSHMSYNITVLDSTGRYVTLFVAPDRETEVLDYPIGTNHQGQVEWEDYAELTETRERLAYLETCLYNQSETKEELIRKFLAKPLYSQKFEKSFETFYTAIYNSSQKTAELHWPNKSICQTFDAFEESKTQISFGTKFSGKLTL